MNCHRIQFKRLGDGHGDLTALEGSAEVPFEIRRVYYITQVPGDVTRGFHSHRRLEQVLLCLNGSVSIRLRIPGAEDEVVTLRDDSCGLYVGHMVWREMFDFSPGAVLMVLASEHYSEDDYIRNYAQYLREATEYFERKNRHEDSVC